MDELVNFNFEVIVNLSNGENAACGAMSFKQVRRVMDSVQEFKSSKGISIVNAEIYPQTAKGRHQMEKDFAIMNASGNINHYSFKEKVPTQTVEI